MKTLYLECSMGAAGDMLMGALYELLDDKADFIRTMNALGLPGLQITPADAVSCGITGTHMAVTVHGQEEHSIDVPHSHAHEHIHEHAHEHTHTHEHTHEHAHEHEHPHAHEHTHSHTALADIRSHIAALPLPEEVLRTALSVYDRLAAAEARVHGRPVEQVHFHEVGALDAVADVVGVCYALSLLRPERIVVSPVHVGSGSVRCAHGIVPVPAPATAVLLEGAPCYGGSIEGELCTPTGAALLTTLADSFGAMPTMRICKTGYGMGSKVFPAANCVRAFWGESEDPSPAPVCGQANGEIVELTCNLDDMTPEALAFACERLLEQGALDVYTIPGQMKKGRPGWVLTVLCQPEDMDETAQRIFMHTSTNGLRARRCAKYFLRPHTQTADTPYGPVRMKYAEGFGTARCKPEADDVAALARAAAQPFDTVWRAAQKNQPPADR
ncbi:MAG: nickel pincer cofactor biosynthesis protein LarC [Agathobaculum sp.]|jgi:uncharacterized protein (TIGR00299 family) protein|uniref:nickel pincer cofactor biosynthesis protein LarC n=1 Tax=Agathobaculum sp. TaxID=2048138 RepID=UPI003D8F48F6